MSAMQPLAQKIPARRHVQRADMKERELRTTGRQCRAPSSTRPSPCVATVAVSGSTSDTQLKRKVSAYDGRVSTHDVLRSRRARRRPHNLHQQEPPTTAPVHRDGCVGKRCTALQRSQRFVEGHVVPNQLHLFVYRTRLWQPHPIHCACAASTPREKGGDAC